MSQKRFLLLLSLLIVLLAACKNENPNKTSQGSEVEAPDDPKPSTGGKGTEVVTPNKPKPSDPEKGELLYAIPDSMELGEKERVEVRVVREVKEGNKEKLTYRLKNKDGYKINTIETSEGVRIRLTEEDTINRKFEIISLSPDKQFILENDVGYWEWTVIPKVAGEHLLIIQVGVLKKKNVLDEGFYDYEPVWDEEVAVISSAEGLSEEATNWTAIGGAIGFLLGLLAAIGLWRKKSQGLLSLPPVEKEELEEVENLIKDGQLDEALDKMETIVKTIRDEEHNLIVSYKADLTSFKARYNSGEISYEELAKVKARIRRGVVEMNDRLGNT